MSASRAVIVGVVAVPRGGTPLPRARLPFPQPVQPGTSSVAARRRPFSGAQACRPEGRLYQNHAASSPGVPFVEAGGIHPDRVGSRARLLLRRVAAHSGRAGLPP
jgi:hypothetical protein